MSLFSLFLRSGTVLEVWGEVGGVGGLLFALYTTAFFRMMSTRASSPVIVAMGKISIAHSRFRCSCGGGGASLIMSGGSLSRCMSLFIGCGLGITTTVSTRLSAATTFRGRITSCHSRRTRRCLVSSTFVRRRTHGACRTATHGVNPSNVFETTRVLVHLRRRTSTRRRTMTGTHVSSVCAILGTKTSFTRVTGGRSRSPNATHRKKVLP